MRKRVFFGCRRAWISAIFLLCWWHLMPLQHGRPLNYIPLHPPAPRILPSKGFRQSSNFLIPRWKKCGKLL